MNYKSKQHLTEVITTAVLSIGYGVFAFSGGAPNSLDLVRWARAILVFMVTLVLINIVAQIIFHVFFSGVVAVEASKTQEENLIERIVASSLRLDERDRQINRYAGNIASWFITISFIVSVVYLAFDGKPVIALHILLAGYIFTLLADDLINVIAYERGGVGEG